MIDCDHCEEVMQPYLDRVLTDSERMDVERHLVRCFDCARRFRFEEDLRVYVRVACADQMPPDLKERLAALRTPLL